jgi:hypothetical protein
MNAASWSIAASVVLFIGMVGLGEIGRRLARRRARAGDLEPDATSLGVVDGAVFGLLGLIVAFSFGGAVGRFDVQRDLVIEEINAIGSTYQFLDLLSDDARNELRETFKRYVDSRISLYRVLPDRSAATARLEDTKAIQAEIWTSAVKATIGNQPGAMLLLPSITGMFDIATTRAMSMLIHPPPFIFALMFALALLSALIAGYGMARSRSRDWIRVVSFASISSVAFFSILDIEFPRSGLIQIENFDLALVQFRAGME